MSANQHRESGWHRCVGALRAAIAGAMLAWSPCALALNPALEMSQYTHTAWNNRDGFTRGAITSIAQTPDGYLWLGTELGLLRFDGVKTYLWQPPTNTRLPSNTIRGLLVSRDGTLWIGTDQGLASLKDGKLVTYEALAKSYVSRLIEDRDGAIWMTRFVASWTLCKVHQGRVTCYGEDGGFGAGALGLFEDREGSLWVGTATGLWRSRSDAPTFYPLPLEANGIRGISEERDGALLIAHDGGVKRLVAGQAVMAYPFPPATPEGQNHRILRDRDGGIWVATARGLFHVHDGLTDVFSESDGLSGDRVAAILEDREGTIWVATTDGLDRFRESAVTSYSSRQGLSSSNVTSVFASADGSVWLGTANALNRWTTGHVTIYRDRRAKRDVAGRRIASQSVREIVGLGASGVHSIFEDSQRRMWVSTADGVGYLDGNRLVLVKGVPGGVTRAIVEDRRKTLWIANVMAGLFHLPGSSDVVQIDWGALKPQDLVSAAAADPVSDALWFGFYRGGVVNFAGGRVRASYTASDGLADGRVSALHVDATGTLWVATDGGLSRLKDGRIVTLTSRNGLPCDAVSWIVEDAARALWLAMPCGLARIARADIDAWTAAAHDAREGVTPTVPVMTFDHTDGFRLAIGASHYTAPAARALDGKLWFMSRDGASVLDPTRLLVNTLPPPVHIEQVIVDGMASSSLGGTGEPLRLPPFVRDLQIDYTALSLVAPDRNLFRYRLEGYDRDWQDAGNRRQAFYTNLPPRTYRFRVIASNNRGVWNETGASLDFSIAPAYYQTTWFMALSAGIVLALVWGAHRIRIGIVQRHEREISALNERLMKAQEQERIRIAGELHDGVMQEMLAVTMMLGTAKRKASADAETKAAIDKVQEKVIKVGTDIRRVSHDLHPPVLQDAGLPQALQVYCEEFSSSSGVPVSCEADENARDLSRGAALALFRIVQEALGNAVKHGAAKHINVRLQRSSSVVSLEVTDDGIGFDRSQLAAAGGLGLITMRERASQLDGTFDVDSAPGRGTTIKVVIPFR
jgi:signal transduction histidine kinase/ligand-binding sensor domain-containing protein